MGPARTIYLFFKESIQFLKLFIVYMVCYLKKYLKNVSQKKKAGRNKKKSVFIVVHN